MKRIRGTPPIHISHGPQGVVRINDWERNVSAELKQRRFEGEEADFRQLIITALIDYWFSKDSDDTSVPPGQLGEFVELVEGRVISLRAALSPDPLDTPANIILGAIDPGRISDLQKALDAFVEAMKVLQLEVGKPGEGSGPRLDRSRQVALAKWLMNEFEQKGWSTKTGNTSLLAYSVGVVLKTAGEEPKDIGDILRAAKKELAT